MRAIHPLTVVLTPPALALVALSMCIVALGGCAAEVSAPVTIAAPVATFTTCPPLARVGEPVTVVGTATSFLPLEQTTLFLPPFDSVEGTTMTVTPTMPGILTARLEISDGKQAAIARCRILVEGEPVAQPPADEEQPIDEETDAPDVADEGDDGEDEGIDAEPPAAAGTPVDLAGQFVMLSYDRSEMNWLTLDPQRQCGVTPTLAIVDMTQDGATISMSMQTCSFAIPAVRVLGADVQVTSVPDALLASIPVQGPFSFDIDAVSGASFAPPLSQVGVPVVLGANLDDPTEELPWYDWDDRVIDSDANGFPGVSLMSSVGAQHLVMRHTIRAFAGFIRSSNLIEGTSEGSFRVDNESSLLSLLDIFVPAGTGLPSTFQIRRVDGQHDALDLRGADGVLTCDDLRAHATQLEASFPPLANPDDCPSY
jgi:hypothetical protein